LLSAVGIPQEGPTVKRLNRILFAVAIGIVAVPALADEPAAERDGNRVQATEEARPEKERRPTTMERWRGRPHLRAANEVVRNQALDKALPPANPVFQGGVTLGF
jgi:hypothetical protein